ncbi:glycosyltransferase [Cryocola sp. 340MFSha3.1]|uniref:glycosyltransferase n=1 Tax=Cryocola sp. 340MFSha3.1 TaxID=1169145 RepID=UPI000364F85F|nr:glycosyltransferase [Cryocola sp. 340MFSha3.1]
MSLQIRADSANRLWPRSTSIFLILVGVVLSVLSFIVVINMPALPWHPARSDELQATYDAFRETGTLLIKAVHSGSYYTQVPAPGPWVSAAWDDDPGAYIVASLMSLVTHSASAYPGLGIAEALLVALPLLWLPTAVARIFKRARAGYAVVLLPPLMWLLNNGTILAGTEYGLSDSVSTTRVYALYGIAASIAFLSLSLLVLFCTFRLRTSLLIAVSCGFVVLAAIGDLSRSLSGMGVAAGVGVLWWLHVRKKWRWLAGLGAAVVAVVLTFGLQTATMTGLNAARSATTGQSMADLPNAHGTWHPLYLGLAYPQPITGQPSPLGIVWSDKFGWDKARAVDPDVVIASDKYDLIIKDLYLDQVKEHPLTVAKLYLQKFLYVVKHFGAMLAFILVGLVLALMRRAPQRRPLGAAIAVTIPTILLGLIPPVLVMPLLYYYSELTAALSILVAISLGGLVWSLTSMPAHVRASERNRLSTRALPGEPRPESPVRLSVIVPTRNGSAVLGGTLATLGAALTSRDEIIVVENGSTDDTWEMLQREQASWCGIPQLVLRQSQPGLGEALRTGVMNSRGNRVLLTADDLPFGMSDYEQFEQLPDDVVVAIGSKAHPDSRVRRSWRRSVQSRIFRFLREALLQSKVGDSQGTIWADGDWCRSLAVVSRESGLMWTTELVLAAEQQGLRVVEVPVVLSESHETGSSRFRFGDAWRSVVGFTRLAVYKDDYSDENWVVPLHPPVSVRSDGSIP